MKLDRLFGILSVLLERERVQAKELAQRFEVSERTIYRDIAALEGAGMPVITFAGSGGGIGILPGYKLDKRLLSRRDMAAINAGLAGLGSIGGDRAVSDLVEKLMPENASALSLESDILIDFSSWDKSSFLLRRIELLRSAITARHCIQIDYVSTGGREERWVEPYKIVFKSNSWYLYAFCRKRQGFRLFKLSRMLEVGEPGEGFTPRAIEGIPLHWDIIAPSAEGSEERVVLRFPASQEYLVMDLFGRDSYETLEDGSLITAFSTADMSSTMYMVLGFGHNVEVVEPGSLKRMLLHWAKKILDRYQT